MKRLIAVVGVMLVRDLMSPNRANLFHAWP